MRFRVFLFLPKNDKWVVVVVALEQHLRSKASNFAPEKQVETAIVDQHRHKLMVVVREEDGVLGGVSWC